MPPHPAGGIYLADSRIVTPITSDTTIEFAISGGLKARNIITWASARGARFSPGYTIAGLQPSESAYDLSHVGTVFDKSSQTFRHRLPVCRGIVQESVEERQRLGPAMR